MQEIEHFIGFDQDEEALELARANLHQVYSQATVDLIHSNFRCVSRVDLISRIRA
jgi:16S rRNA C1402 N4-methylase RsmH